MKCAEVKLLLDFLTDGEIEPAQKGEIENHLRNCDSCRIYFGRWQATALLLKNYLPVSAPPALDAKILSAFKNYHSSVSPQPEKQRFRQKIFIPVPVFAATLAIFALAIATAYQFGKMSGAKSVAANETTAQTLPEKVSAPVQPASQTLVKYVETPVTRIVRVPVIKERKVTRIVYKNNSPEKNFSAEAPANSQVAATGKNPSVNLKGFLPVSEIKFKIIRNEEKQ